MAIIHLREHQFHTALDVLMNNQEEWGIQAEAGAPNLVQAEQDARNALLDLLVDNGPETDIELPNEELLRLISEVAHDMGVQQQILDTTPEDEPAEREAWRESVGDLTELLDTLNTYYFLHVKLRPEV